VFGIPNCNTVKKALDFFKSQGVSIEFHDFKKQGVSPDLLEDWAKQHAWENLLNKKGTTWRGLSAEEQQAALHWQGAVALMQQRPSVIKRPVTHWPNGAITIGFDEAIFSSNI
jgi:Spx/MgsR family transcriptional regulator